MKAATLYPEWVITIEIPGKPAPMPRTRPRMRRGKVAGMVWPEAYGKWRAGAQVLVTAAWHRGGRRPRFSGPVQIHVVATWPRPKACPDWLPREFWATGVPCRRPTTPDGDNVLKTCQDLLNGVAYVDDGQVCDARVECWMAGVGEAPSTLITVAPLPWMHA